MEILLSWSGKTSRLAARQFHQWLPKVLPEVKPWHSTYDIEKGRRWFDEIKDALTDARACIVFLTAENVDSPWLYWESGAIASAKGDTSVDGERGPRIMPLLIGIPPSAITGTPLAQYQATTNEREQVILLIEGLNRELGNRFNSDELLGRIDRHWHELERELARILHEAMPAHIQVLTRSLSSLVSRLAKEWHIAASADDNNAVQQLLSSVYKDYQDIQKRDCKTEREAAFLLTGQQHVYRAYNAGSHRGRLEQGASLEQLLSKLITDIEGPYR